MKNGFKKALAALVILCLFGVHTSFAQCTASLFAGGTGTETNPYQISNAQQLQNLNQCLGSNYQNNYYVLNGNIDLTPYLQGAGNNSGAGWQPIGSNNSNSFQGKFNGNGHKVFGLWIDRPSQSYIGLFGYAYKAEIRNIGVEIDDSKGEVRGGDFVGGLVGGGYGIIISNSYATGNVTGNGDSYGYVGGLAGYGDTISDSYATGNVTGNGYVGGLAGSGIIISNSYATGSVTGNGYVGGLAGSSGTISDSYATGNVTGNGYYVGGLVGNGGTISNSYATGNVTGGSEVGGLVGDGNSGTISNSYATGSVSGNSFAVGGLVGDGSSGTISDSYATGNVTGNSDYVGGLVGNGNSGTISNSYYDKETSGRTDAWKGIGKSTAEMKTQGTYEGWDFEGIWEINPAKNNGYPVLLWQNPKHIASSIVAIPNQTWTGSPITPKPSVNFKGNNLIERTDFEYSYGSNVQTGTAILRIVGKGAYLGQAKAVEFRIIAATCGTGFESGGTGTEADPYKITDARSLDAISNCLRNDHSGKHYELQNDIDLGGYIANSSAGWQPIGNSSNSFQGKFNGNGHKVSGLWIYRPSQRYIGLFGYVSSAEIRNIGVEIDDSKGGVRGYYSVGGLVGYGIGGTISNSYTTGSVTGMGISPVDWVGGLAGSNSGTISNSYATGSVTGMGTEQHDGYLLDIYIGGLVGRNSGTISDSYATGSVTGMGTMDYIGGLVGYGSGGTISNSYATGNVTGNGNGRVGGLVGGGSGYYGFTISNSYATGNGTGNGSFVGGLVGYGSGGTISNSYYDKETSGRTDTGKGIGKSTAEMKTQSTYEGWDFEDTWAIANIIVNKGYPILQWQLQGKTVLEGAAISSISSQPYNGSVIEPAFDLTFNGAKLAKNTDYSVHYSNNRNAGTAKVTASGKGIYLGSIEAYFEITAKPITITGVTATNREYNGTTTVTLAGGVLKDVLPGDDVSFVLGSGTVAGVGNNKAVATNITLTGTDAYNYTLAQPSVTANITAKPVTITGLSASDKEYSGTTAVTIIGTATISGKIGVDDVTVISGTALFEDKNAGNNKTVTFSGFSLGGRDAGNYTLAQPASVTANITAKPITITEVTATSRAYNGTTTVSLAGGVLNGVLNEDAVGFVFGSGTVATPDVGSNKAVTPVIILTGADAANYTPANTNNIAVDIWKADGGAVATPTLAGKTHNSIAINAVAIPIGQTVEYAIKNENTVPNDATTVWQTASEFTGLISASDYYIFARPKEDANYKVGTISSSLHVKTDAVPSSSSTTPSSSSSTPSSSSKEQTPQQLCQAEKGVWYKDNCYSTQADKNEAVCYEKDGQYWEDGKCKKYPTPVKPATIASGKLIVRATTGGINIENLPQNAKVEVYNLQGKLVYSAYPGNPSILRIGVQTKGMYVVKIGSQKMRVIVR
jgi:energy-converting hydrogenase Eha subunit F